MVTATPWRPGRARRRRASSPGVALCRRVIEGAAAFRSPSRRSQALLPPRAIGDHDGVTTTAAPARDASRAREQLLDALWAGFLAIVFVALSVGWVASRLGLVHKPRYVLETDHLVYIEMAKQPLGGVPGTLARSAPFCWRVLTPALARGLMGLGLRVHGAFYLVTQAGLLAFLTSLFLLLRRQGFLRGEAALGVALVGLLPGAVRWYEYQYWMSDPMALASLVLVLLVLEARCDRQLAWLGPLSAAIRESYVLVLPYVALRRWRESGPARAAGTLAWAAILPAGVLLLLRSLIVPDHHPDWVRALVDGTVYRLGHLGPDQLYALSVGSFGAMLLAPLLWPERLARALVRRPQDTAFLVGVFSTLLVASNTDRLLAYSLPIVAPLFLLALRRAAADWGVPFRVLGLVALVLQLQLFVVAPFRRPGLSIHPQASLLVAATYALVLVAGWALRWRAGRERASPPR